MNSPHPSPNPSLHQQLRRFAWLIAGPRDGAINFVINGAIAWFLYHRYTAVPLVTGHSVFSMLLPMTFILTAVTTFFGYFNGVQFVKSHTATTDSLGSPAWIGKAIRSGLLCGFLGSLALWGVLLFCQRYYSTPSFSATTVVLGIACYAGALGYAFHSLAVIRSGRL